MASTGSVSAWDEALLIAMIQSRSRSSRGRKTSRSRSSKSARRWTIPRRVTRPRSHRHAGVPYPGANTAIWTYDEMLLTLDSPEIGEFKKACARNKGLAVSS